MEGAISISIRFNSIFDKFVKSWRFLWLSAGIDFPMAVQIIPRWYKWDVYPLLEHIERIFERSEKNPDSSHQNHQ